VAFTATQIKVPREGKPRILHVIKSLPFGGIETWLVHMFRQHSQFDVQHELLLMKEEPGVYEPEVRRLGIPIHKIEMGEDKIRWFVDVKRFLATKGPFDAIHSHVGLVAGAPLLAVAKMAGVPVRIAHSHEARSQGVDHRSLRKRLMRLGAILLFKRVSTRRIGISEAAMEEISGKSWRDDRAGSILLYGFDFDQNIGGVERAKVLRQNLGIKDGDPIVGHVGRFDPVKNHDLLIRSFAELTKRVPNAHLVMVGKGRLQPDMERLAADLGVSSQVHFAGPSGDVPAFMALFDVFAFPSFSEGLGIVALEAQAAGTRSLVSDTVPAEVAVVEGAVEMLPLEAGVKGWSEAMERMLAMERPDPADWREQVEGSYFGIRRCVDDLNQIYLQELERPA